MVPTTPDNASVELLDKRLQLRPDVRCAKHAVGDCVYYQLADPLTSRFYRIGAREWAVVRRLTGQQTLKQMIQTPPDHAADESLAADPESDFRDASIERSQDPAQHRPPDSTASLRPLAAEELASLGRWLLQTQLAVIAGENTASPGTPPPRGKLPSFLNIAFLKIPLFNPDRLVAMLLPALRWTISPAAALMWAIFCAAVFAQLIVHWERFSRPIDAILAPDNWIYLLISWIGLKAVHELYHGLVCKRYGGQVPSCGLLFILFSPVAFVDVTSSWRFRSKWQRVYTAAAGMYAELFIAALAVYVWLHTEHGIVNQLSHNVITMASFSTLLFNGNFLMRFDGYYMLSDAIEVQNLYANGQHYVRYLVRRYLLGLPGNPLPAGAQRPTFTKLYGIASLFWRMSFYCGVTLTAAAMFHGAGILVAVMIGVGWFFVPAWRFVRYMSVGQQGELPDRRRFSLVIGTAAVILGGVLCLPWPGGIVATGVVEYEPLTVVRASSGGFLQSITCRPGDLVRAGQELAQIENRPVELELAELRIAREQSEIRCRALQSAGDYDLYQIESARRDSLLEQLEELQAKVKGLRVSAPVDGCVLGRDLESRTGEFVSGGEPVLSLGSEHRKAIRVAISQQDAEHYLRQLGTTPYVRIRGRGLRVPQTRLAKVNPRATRQLPHPALAATYGGPLPVSMGEQGAAESENSLELVEPHFHAIIELPEPAAAQLRAGEVARVRLGATGESVGSHLLTAAGRWIQRKLAQGAG